MSLMTPSASGWSVSVVAPHGWDIPTREIACVTGNAPSLLEDRLDGGGRGVQGAAELPGVLGAEMLGDVDSHCDLPGRGEGGVGLGL